MNGSTIQSGDDVDEVVMLGSRQSGDEVVPFKKGKIARRRLDVPDFRAWDIVEENFSSVKTFPAEDRDPPEYMCFCTQAQENRITCTGINIIKR